MKLVETTVLATATLAVAAVLAPAGSQDQRATGTQLVAAQNVSAATAEVTGVWLVRERGAVLSLTYCRTISSASTPIDCVSRELP
ncbi:MAG: hypothetical protein FJX56_04950 [Alphaproteobacteria bacterium]|nr:hypothetical protein [Alphaproteobacteria bacterium]